MKMIDIHTKNEAINGGYNNPISSDLTKGYVYQNIDFNLPENLWEMIENVFSYIWNEKLGVGGHFYWEEVSTLVYNGVKQQLEYPFWEIEKQHVLLPFERVDKIVTLILTYIESTPSGMLE